MLSVATKKSFNLFNFKLINYGKLFREISSDFSNIIVNEEVIYALKHGKPVVALESTIITHGMPYPNNIQCAMDVENVVRKQGGVPATVAIIEGKIKVGLNNEELTKLADVNSSKPIKTSRRDLSYVLCNKHNGGTTVSATLIVANKTGIPIFATGGIGGVHRGGEVTFDVSADLVELGKSHVAVVSSGVKSILDIPKTLEYLETQGVFVATFGSTSDFPAFYSRKSGCFAPYSVKTALEAAKIIQTNKNLNLNSGMLFAVPVPEEFSLNFEELNEVIDAALKEAETLNISGKETTPFLLSKIAKITAGKSLNTNIALIKNNAKIATQIAVQLSNLENKSDNNGTSGVSIGKKTNEGNRPVIIGGSNLDCQAKLKDLEIKVSQSDFDYSKYCK